MVSRPSHHILSSKAQLLYRIYHFTADETKIKNINILKLRKAIMEPKPNVELIYFPLSESKYHKVILYIEFHLLVAYSTLTGHLFPMIENLHMLFFSG